MKRLTSKDINLIKKNFLDRVLVLNRSTITFDQLINGSRSENDSNGYSKGTNTIVDWKDIKQKSVNRNYIRQIKPSIEWLSKYGIDNGYIINRRKINDNPKIINDIKLNNLYEDSWQIGDLVLTRSLPSQISIIVHLPTSILDPRYTILTINGDIVFETKSNFILRVPMDIINGRHCQMPLYNDKLKLSNPQFLIQEQNYLYDKIGEIKDNYNINQNFTSSTNAAKTENLYGSDTMSRGDELFLNEHVSYIVPNVVKDNLINNLSSVINTKNWINLPQVNKILSNLINDLNHLQINNISIHQLVFLVNHSIEKHIDKIPEHTLKELLLFFNSSKFNLHKRYHTNEDKKITSILFAIFWCLNSNQKDISNKINITINKSIGFPINVSIAKNDNSERYQNLTDTIMKYADPKNFKLIENFCSLINSAETLNKKNDFLRDKYPDLVYLIENFISNNNNVAQSSTKLINLLTTIFRKLDLHRDQNVSRDNWFKLMKKVLNLPKFYNPLLLNDNLLVPIESEKLYQIASPGKETTYTTNTPRATFDDLPVYCIDNDNAYEIDDGISIIKLDKQNTFKLLIHIADPSIHFLKKINNQNNYTNKDKISNNLILTPDTLVQSENLTNLEIFNESLKRSFTTYLPDLVIPMLPKSFTRLSDMGIQGKKTKTMTFSIDCEISTDNNDEKIDLVWETFKIELSEVFNFPKVNYDKVDEILNNQTEDKKNPINEELKLMFKIAKLLRKKRIFKDNAIIFGEGFNKGQVSVIKDSCNDDLITDVKFFDQNEKSSTILVSEFMILANSLTGRFFRDNQIPGVFRCYNELNLTSNAKKQYKSLTDNLKLDKELNINEMTKFSSLLNSSFYYSRPIKHSMIGCNNYLTVTSPLRRFPDLVNHLQIHSFLYNKSFFFDQIMLDKIIWRIQSRDVVIRKLSQQTSKFFTLTQLHKILEEKPETHFDLLITSYPENAKVRCTLKDYSFAQGFLKFKKELPPPSLGSIVENCKVIEINPVEGFISLEQI